MTTFIAAESRGPMLLAPLPISTDQPASDLMNIVWRKNDVYLDIGSFAMGGG